MIPENLLNVNQVAFILKVHPLTIRRYIKEEKLKAVKVAGNVRIKESELADFNSKAFTPNSHQTNPLRPFKKPAKAFTEDDPFFRLKGRGASLHLSSDQST